MVKQGDIIKVSFDPQRGHEQAGYRPAIVVSNNVFNQKANVVLLCPITNTRNNFPLHVCLDERTKTTGSILCEQIKALDLNIRAYSFVERVPQDILTKTVNIIFSEIEEI